MTPGQLARQQDASIILHSSLFESSPLTNLTDIGIFFGLYETSTLFPVRQEKNDSNEMKRTKLVGSSIVSAAVGVNTVFKDLPEPVECTFRLQNKPGMVMDKLR